MGDGLGWIKLPREILDDPIIKKPKLLQLYMYCYLRANHQESKIIFNDSIIKIERGSFITGRKKISMDLNIHETTIYNRLKSLRKLNYISIKPNSKFSILTIVNYDRYQSYELKDEQQHGNKITTGKQQTNTDNNDKNDKNVKKFIPPTIEQVKEFVTGKGYNEELAERVFEYYDLADWHDKNGNKVRNWKQKILAVWLKEENKTQKEENLIEFKRDE